MDAPAHCFKGGATIDELSLENLVTECVVIKIPNADEGYCIMPDVVRDFENTHGRIPEHAFVIFATGWSARWTQPEMYRNNLQFPSVHETTAQLLLERNISGLGTDTLSADTGKNGFPVHQAILGAGKYLVENIAHAEALPETGSRVAVLPLKIKEGTESPVRLIGLL
jgi:kynurenine formamidase